MHSTKLSAPRGGLIAVLAVVSGIAASGQGAAVAQERAAANQRPAERRLLYVASPGATGSENGIGILVFDVNRNFRFVKRIATFDYPASKDPCCEFGTVFFGEEVRGIAAHAATGMIYISTGRRLAAFSLLTDKKVWEYEEPNGHCCDRHAITPDGKAIYAPSLAGPRVNWFVLDALTGKPITTVRGPDGAHNTIISADGSRVYMEGIASKEVFILDPKTHKVIQRVGPFTDMVRPFTINGAGTLVFATLNNLLGFEIGDIRTGKMIHRVEVADFDSGPKGPGRNPSHGIAISPDEKEIWVADDVNGYVHLFDATVMPPQQKPSIKLRRRTHGWITVGLDGQYVYPSSGDVIDAATKKIVAGLYDEFGKEVTSEKMVEVAFSKGKPLRAVDQFGVGQVRASAPSN
jgi:DNA-binding beta-propeller fold protein YncE